MVSPSAKNKSASLLAIRELVLLILFPLVLWDMPFFPPNTDNLEDDLLEAMSLGETAVRGVDGNSSMIWPFASSRVDKRF